MPLPGRSNALDHVVVIMFENRSFDNLLGRLYQPGEIGRRPSYGEYAQIMTGYTPEQMPVVSALARGFAVFDHWFCEVPSQTFANRSFFHAGTSSGFVVNTAPPDCFPVHNTAETIFERIEAKGLSWRVYCDPPSHISLTGLISGGEGLEIASDLFGHLFPRLQL
jgi:phospholipase C